MNIVHHRNKSRTTPPPCCSPSAAWVWVNAVAEMALIYHDDDAARALASVVDHAVRMSQVGAPR